MNEHDDDLDSTVHEGVEGEEDTFPSTDEELDVESTGEAEDEDGDLNRDEDEAEL